MNNKKIVEKYELQRELGAGQFGKVYLAQHVETKEFVAIKSILVESLKQHDGLVGQLLANEINFLAQIDNENVIQLITYFQSKNNVYIVTELCEGGDLNKYWETKKFCLSENEALGIFKQILNGLIGLHERNIVHRDLKMANILFGKGGVVKVADLGFSARMKSQNDLLSQILGTPGTMAPEVALHEPYGLKADIFSLGVILYQMIFGEFPFNPNPYQFLNDIKTKELTYNVKNIQISKYLQTMLKGMLEPDQFKRISFTELYQQLLAFPNPAQQQFIPNQLVINSSFYENRQIEQPPINLQQVQIQPDLFINGIFQPQFKQLLPVNVPDTTDVIINQFLDQNITECNINNEVTKYKDTFNAILFIQCTLNEVQNLNNYFDTNFLQFVLVKTILIELQKLLTLTQVHRNIFNTNQLDEVYSNPQFDALLNQMVEVEIQEKSKFQHLQNIVTLQIPTLQRQFTQQLLKVINSEHDQQFHQNYREILKIYTQQIDQWNQQIENYVQIYHLYLCTHFQYIVTQRLNIKEEFQDIRKKSIPEIKNLMETHQQRIFAEQK